MAATTDLAVLQRLVAVSGRDVLDVGCGNGWLARGLAAGGARVAALEISESQLTAARAADHGDGTVSYAVGRAQALPFPDASQDVVVFMRSLHHVPIEAMGTALDEARRVLRPGGAVYVGEPLAEGAWFALQSVIEVETETRAAAQAALADAPAHGLRKLAAERYETETVLTDAEAFAHRMHAVDPDRRGLLEARRDELERTFARVGTPGPDGAGRVFTHANRAEVLGPS